MIVRRLAWIVGAALFIMFVNVVLSVLYIVFYSYVINPGHDERFYQEYAKPPRLIAALSLAYRYFISFVAGSAEDGKRILPSSPRFSFGSSMF